MIAQVLQFFSNILTWWIVVAPWEQALRIRMGKKVTLLRAGIHVRIPVMDKFYVQSTRLRRSVTRPQTITTLDGHAVTVSGSFGFAIADLHKLFDTIDSPSDSLEAMVAALIATRISSLNICDVNTKDVQEYVDERLDLEQFGLAASDFVIVSMVVVKTYRLITGDLPSWNYSGGIDMGEHSVNSNRSPV